MNVMLRLLLVLVGFSLSQVCGAAEPDILVFDHVEIRFLTDALKRLALPFHLADKLEPLTLLRSRIVVLAGKDLPRNAVDAKVLARYLQDGGRVLALGGGAKWMIEENLFDATGYYPTGTTTHMSTFEGYHRLTFGYPVAAPKDNWVDGVPSLLRATGGPLMHIGPKAHSVLSAGGPFSLLAFQRHGPGIALLICPDPQGGNEFLTLEKPTPRRGDELGTDRLLANALAWLRDSKDNLIPNSGFEESPEAGPEKSHWFIKTSKGGSSDWNRTTPPEGKVCLTLRGGNAMSFAAVSPHLPIIVEGNATYWFSCRYRATAPCSLELRYFQRDVDRAGKTLPQTLAISAAKQWQSYQVEVRIPDGATLLSLTLRLQGAGEIDVDDIALRLK